MANETLRIENVNLEMLETQRKFTNSLYDKITSGKKNLITADEKDGLNGILAMLDSWSDSLYFEKKYNLEKSK